MAIALSKIGQEPAPLVWSNVRYLALVESGIIEDGRGVELIEGQVVTTMPQGELHQFLFFALQAALAALGGFGRGLRAQPTIQVAEGQTYNPAFAILRPEALALRRLPTGAEVLWVAEVSVTSQATDLGPKKAAYAAAGIPDYWVFDAIKRGVWTFSEPVDGEYRRGIFVPAGEGVVVPVLGRTLDTGAIFPQEDSPAPQ